MSGKKMAIVCRYGGKFIVETDKISYEDGTNRLIYVDPTIDYSSFQSQLSEFCDLTAIHSIRYQHPELGLDALVSIKSDVDIVNMKHAFSSQPNRFVQLFISGTQKTLKRPRADSKDKGQEMMSGDPMYGCAGAICQHQKQVSEFQIRLAEAQTKVSDMQCEKAPLLSTIYSLQIQLLKAQAELIARDKLISIILMNGDPSRSRPLDSSDDDNDLGHHWEPLWT